MGIKKITVKNFTVFEKLDVEFGTGINVIVGENGTGKTHLLKLLYTICEINKISLIARTPSLESRNGYKALGFALIHSLFNINNVDDIYKDLSINEFTIDVSVDSREYHMNFTKENIKENVDELINELGTEINKIRNELNKIETEINKRENESNELKNKLGNITYEEPTKSVFIPVVEMLSHSKGFLNLNQKYKLPFDKTQVDIIVNAGLPELREIPDISKKVIEKISNIINGEVIFENDNYFILKKDGRKILFSMEAEGLRKFALLWQLLKNGSIETGSILLWDEPEANINPKLIPTLVEILLELQRNGIQIFVTTHDYIFAKYFEVKQKENDNIIFHSLYETEKV